MATTQASKATTFNILNIKSLPKAGAWEQARARYIDDLNPSERELFETASLETIFYDASAIQKRHEANSSSRRFISQLQPFIEGIEQYGTALDVYSNASSLILCPLWGSIRVLLHLGREFGKYFDRLVKIFQEIDDVLPRLRDYEDLFSKHDRLARAISEAYLAILKFCTKAKAIFRKGSQREYGESLDQFYRHQSAVEKEAELAHLKESLIHREVELAHIEQSTVHRDVSEDIRKKVEDLERAMLSKVAQDETQEETKWFMALRTSDYVFNKDKNPEHLPRTCEWLLGHEKYRAWLEIPASRLLLVSADPGCGKSVLARFLVNNPDLANFDQEVALCYFFLKDDDEHSKSAYHALSAKLYQLFSQRRYLLRLYAASFIQMGRPSFEDLWTILIKCCADATLSGVMCVLDGLDECADTSRSPFIQKLSSFFESPSKGTKLKFLVTSRPYTFIRNAFRRSGYDTSEVQLMGENSAERAKMGFEISLVIDEKIKQFRETRRWNGIEDTAHELISYHISKIENTTYLWVALIFPELDMYAGASTKELMSVLKTLPETVTEVYEKILSRSLNRTKATKLLHIVTAAMRPLTLDELNIAMALEEDDRSEKDMCLTSRQSFPTLIRDLCGLFVQITNGRVFLVHQSAKDFLQATSNAHSELSSTPKSPQQIRWEHSLDPAQSHRILALVCYWYWNFDSFQQERSGGYSSSKVLLNKDRKRSTLVLERPRISFVDDHKFLRYAATYRNQHYDLAAKTISFLRQSRLCVVLSYDKFRSLKLENTRSIIILQDERTNVK